MEPVILLTYESLGRFVPHDNRNNRHFALSPSFRARSSRFDSFISKLGSSNSRDK